MKKRVFNLLNFLSLNVLFFAIYLNFIHKDHNMLPAVSAASNVAARKLTNEELKNPVASTTKEKPKTQTAAY